MNKIILKLISLTVILIMSILLMFSCLPWVKYNDEFHEDLPAGVGWKSIFPNGWTGGGLDKGTHHGLEIEHWWIESYDELIVATDKLKSHGSTFELKNIALMNYEGDLFDVKYCIVINVEHGTQKIEFGDDPFDRKAINVRIYTYGFFDNVTIDELNYSDISEYDHFEYCNSLNLNEYEYSYLPNNLAYRRDGLRVKIYDEDTSTVLVILRNDINDWENLTPSVTEETIQVIINSNEFLHFGG